MAIDRFGRFALLLAGLAAAAPAWAGDPPPEPPKNEKNDAYPVEFRERVNKAVDAGVANILARQKPDGSWASAGELDPYPLGVTALQTLACLKGGTRGDDPRIEKAFGFMRTLPMDKTYSVGVLLMALHAKYAGSEETFTEEKVDQYGNREVRDPCLNGMTPADREWMKKGVDFLLTNQQDGHWRYPDRGVDLSNTQYALLGLWAASRCGMKIPPDVWFTAMEWLLTTQDRTGPECRLRVNEVRGDYRIAWTEPAKARGFRYRPEELVTGAMTTAGMAGLAICQDELWQSRRFTPEMRARTRKGIRDAMAWMQENFDVTKNPGLPQGGWHYYYLYGLERAGMISRSRFMGRWDWYLEGAQYLLAAQDSDGSWTSEHKHLDTAFAVLFLKRATSRTRASMITPTEQDPAAPPKK